MNNKTLKKAFKMADKAKLLHIAIERLHSASNTHCINNKLLLSLQCEYQKIVCNLVVMCNINFVSDYTLLRLLGYCENDKLAVSTTQQATEVDHDK